MRGWRQVHACITLLAWVCLVQRACAFQPPAHSYTKNGRFSLQMRQLRTSPTAVRFASISRVRHGRHGVRPTALQFQGEDELAGVLSQEEKVRLAELESIVPPPDVQRTHEGLWERICRNLWSSLLPSGAATSPEPEADDTFIEQLQNTLLASPLPTNVTEESDQQIRFPRDWMWKSKTNNTLLDNFLAEAAELASARASSLPSDLMNSPRDRLWVRRVLARYDPLHPVYARAFVDSNLALHENMRPNLTPQSANNLRTLAATPSKFLAVLRKVLPPVAGLTAAAVMPAKRPIVRAATALLGAFAGGRVAQRLRHARQQAIFHALADIVRQGDTLSASAREALQQEYYLSAEDLSVALMATFGDEMVRIVVESAIVGEPEIHQIVQLSKQLGLSEMEVAHAVWKVAQLWQLLFTHDADIDFEYRNYPTVDDVTDSQALHTVWQEVASEDELSQPTILWLGYHAHMLEAVWKLKQSSAIRGSNLIQEVSQRIGVQKVASALVQVLQVTQLLTLQKTTCGTSFDHLFLFLLALCCCFTCLANLATTAQRKLHSMGPSSIEGIARRN